MKVGDMVSWNSSGGRAMGRITRIVRNGKINVPNSSFTITGTEDDPAALIRLYRDGEPTDTFVGHKLSTLRSVSKMEKAETYKPTTGMQSAAKRALRWKEEGKATGAGTAVGWARANQLANRENLSLDTVKRMYSYFSRHEVDKKGKGFYDGPEFPSNGRIMWDAWGGDGGFTWSRRIVERANAKKDIVWQDSPFSFRKSND